MKAYKLIMYEGDEEWINATLERSIENTLTVGKGRTITGIELRYVNLGNLVFIEDKLERAKQQMATRTTWGQPIYEIKGL